MIKMLQQMLAQIPHFKRVVVGISGGADSVALAHALHTLGYEVILAHLNHGLRGVESDADQVFIERLAQKWGLPLAVTQLNMPKEGNLENHCRQIRYEFLEEVRQKYRAKFIAVAHHQKDQVESILMHMERGAGPRGMCGMYVRRNKIIRPLLKVKKDRILHYIHQHHLKYRTDSSNTDLRFKRNYVRHKVIPRLEKKWKNFQSHLIKLSDISKKRLHKIQKRAKAWSTHFIQKNRFSRSAFLRLPPHVQSEVLLQILGHQDVYRSGVEVVKKLIAEGRTGKQKSVKNTTFILEYDEVIFFTNTDSHQIAGKKPIEGKVAWGRWVLSYKGKEKLYVRGWEPGDRFEPNGMGGSKKLQDFFVDQKVPRRERKSIPIIVNQKNEILSVGDLRLSKKGVFLKEVLELKRDSIIDVKQ